MDLFVSFFPVVYQWPLVIHPSRSKGFALASIDRWRRKSPSMVKPHLFLLLLALPNQTNNHWSIVSRPEIYFNNIKKNKQTAKTKTKYKMGSFSFALFKRLRNTHGLALSGASQGLYNDFLVGCVSCSFDAVSTCARTERRNLERKEITEFRCFFAQINFSCSLLVLLIVYILMH